MTTPVKIHRRQKHTTALIGHTGEILVWTMIRVPAKSFSSLAPYPVAIVKLENGKKIAGQIVDWRIEDLKSGKKVVTVLRRCGIEDHESVITYSIKFRPLSNEQKLLI